MNAEELQSKEGIIVMLDSLGVRNMKIDEAKNFIKIRDKIFSKPPDKNLISLIEKKEDIVLGYPKIITFGDSIVLTWERIKTYDSLLVPIAHMLASLMKNAFDAGILLRGAISYGEYIDDGKNSILGPAINDAVSWYDIGNWMGIICTPRCGIKIARIIERYYLKEYIEDISEISALFCYIFYDNYNVPLNDGRQIPLWCISWPFSYISINKDNILKTKVNKQLFLSHIEKYPIPLGVEVKYIETINYVDWYIEYKLNEVATIFGAK